jgi:outer membrane protein assembly factor BamA
MSRGSASRSGPRLRACGIACGIAFGALSSAAAQAPTDVVTEIVTVVRVEQEGQVVTDPAVAGLIETKVGAPYSAKDVRESIAHLISLNRFEDVQVFRQPVAGGVALRFTLLPLHPVDRVEFRGDLGLAEANLRRVVTETFGDPPRAAQAAAIAAALRRTYQTRGYPGADVAATVEETHGPDRASLVVVVKAGPQAVIDDVRFGSVDGTDLRAVTERPNIRRGQRYDSTAVEQELADWTARMRGRGYYEARASHGVSYPPGGAFVSVSLSRGPRVVVAFEGDRLSSAEQERLVPVRAEASADEDLLEDSTRAIQDFLRERGYRDASVMYTRAEQDGQLTITFVVTRGPRFIFADIQLTGQTIVPVTELRTLLRVQSGDAFVQSMLDRGIAAILEAYRVRGYTATKVERRMSEVAGESVDSTRRVTVALAKALGRSCSAWTSRAMARFPTPTFEDSSPSKRGDRIPKATSWPIATGSISSTATVDTTASP